MRLSIDNSLELSKCIEAPTAVERCNALLDRFIAEQAAVACTDAAHLRDTSGGRMLVASAARAGWVAGFEFARELLSGGAR